MPLTWRFICDFTAQMLYESVIYILPVGYPSLPSCCHGFSNAKSNGIGHKKYGKSSAELSWFKMGPTSGVREHSN